jgi:hypothetical protein
MEASRSIIAESLLDGRISSAKSAYPRQSIRQRKHHYTDTNQIMQLDTLDVSLPRGVLILLF